MGIAVYQQRTSTSKVQRAAVQMQLFSQAVTDYYNDHGRWPIPFNSTTLGQYIPYGDKNTSNQYLNPWGETYTSSTTVTTATFYNITTTTPAENTADQIKSKLPFAQLNQTDTKQLMLAIPAPGLYGASNFILKRTGYAQVLTG